MKSGVATADITPEPGPVLQGHWSSNPSHSVLYPLEVRAIVFEEGGGEDGDRHPGRHRGDQARRPIESARG